MNESMSPMDGVELLPLLRRVTKSPIVVVGAGDEADIVQTLLQGADIYVTQPVNAKELVARTQALLRRNPAKDKYVGGASQDNPLDGAQLNNIFSRLSHTEGRLFRYLLEHGERLVATQELVAGVWGEYGKDTSLRFYIRQLRRKLAEVASIEILNLKGLGYLLKVRPAGAYEASWKGRV